MDCGQIAGVCICVAIILYCCFYIATRVLPSLPLLLRSYRLEQDEFPMHTCGFCGGTGDVETFDADIERFGHGGCPVCNGPGRVGKQ